MEAYLPAILPEHQRREREGAKVIAEDLPRPNAATHAQLSSSTSSWNHDHSVESSDTVIGASQLRMSNCHDRPSATSQSNIVDTQ
eukprot:2152044-Rhodomonas_salina.2